MTGIPEEIPPGGLRYKPPDVIGKHRYRVRETYLRDHVVPLLRSHRVAAAKLDLVLRGLALSPQHLGRRPTPGVVLSHIAYEDLFDLVRPADRFGPPTDPAGEDYDADVRALKRKWVGEQSQVLERCGLLRRELRDGRRRHLWVLRDDRSGKPFDDPDGSPGNTYATMLGAVIASGELAKWGTPELVAYLAAMVAERHDPGYRPGETPPGSGRWYRAVAWFDSDRRPAHQVRIPFAPATLERGLARLEASGLVDRAHHRRDPATGRRFRTGRRNVYLNRFATLNELVAAQTVTAEQLDAALRSLETDAPEPEASEPRTDKSATA